MSLATLRKLLVPETQLELPFLVALAQSRQKNVTIFDVETTTFMGNPSFAIIEIAMLHINHKGQLGWTTALVNPERAIAPSASQKTGIYSEDVANADNWAKAWAEAMHHIADKHIVIGFNCVDSACPAVQDQNLRYGFEPIVFNDVIDVRSLWQVLQKGKKGSLADVAAFYAVPVDETHRAQADVVTTAKILDKMVAAHGVAIMSHPQRNWSAKTGTPSPYTPVDSVQEGADATSELAVAKPIDAIAQAREAVKGALTRASSMREFITIVEETFPVRITMGNNKILGYWLSVEGQKVKGSQVGTEYTWSALVKERGLDFDPLHDMSFFKARAENVFGESIVTPSPSDNGPT